MHEISVYKGQSDFDMFGNPNWEMFPTGDYVFFVDWEDDSADYKTCDYPPLRIKNHCLYMSEVIRGCGRFFGSFCPFLEGVLPEGDFCLADNRGMFVSILRVTVQVKGICRGSS